jgi:tetratricopeptide (TPR) repeat protein
MIEDDEERARASEAEYELAEIRARKGLEYLDDDPDAALDSDFVLIRDYDEMCQRTPNDAGAHEHFGQRFMQARLHGQALAAFKRVVNLMPRSARAQFNCGEAIRADVIMKFGGDFNAPFIEALKPALTHYEAACQLDPSFREAQERRDSVRRDIEIARLNEQRRMRTFEQIVNDPKLDKDAQAKKLIEAFGPEAALEMIDRATEVSERKQAAYTEKAEHYEERMRQADQKGEATVGRPIWRLVRKLTGK